jgi:hypothetical protein
VPLPQTGPSDGQVRLGLSVANGDDPPPYAVTFAAVAISDQ